jgi:hypothetical protein
VAGVVLGLAACGPTPPQAPLAEAQKLDNSTGTISNACGMASQFTDLGGSQAGGLESLESQAIAAAHKLAGVYHRNPHWIYQGDTVRQIVDDSLSMHGACGLSKAQAALRHAAYGR